MTSGIAAGGPDVVLCAILRQQVEVHVPWECWGPLDPSQLRLLGRCGRLQTAAAPTNVRRVEQIVVINNIGGLNR